MAELMLINPRRRKRRKMSPLQRQYFGKRRAKRNPVRRKRRRAAHRNPVATHRRRRHHAVARANPVRRRRHRRAARRNPISLRRGFNIKSIVQNDLIPAAIGGAGALGVDVALAMLPIPASWKAGPLAPITKIAGAIGIGMIAKMVVGKKTADAVTLGAITVTAYDIIKSQIRTLMPSLPLSEYVSGIGYVSPAYSLPYYPSGVGEYVSGSPGNNNGAYFSTPNDMDEVF